MATDPNIIDQQAVDTAIGERGEIGRSLLNNFSSGDFLYESGLD